MAILDLQNGFWSIRRQMEALIGPGLANSVLQQAGTNGGAFFAQSFGRAQGSTGESRLFAECLQAYQTAGFGKFEIQDLNWPVGKIIIQAQGTFEGWMMRQHGQPVEGPICAYTTGVLVGFINVISQRQDVVCIEHHCQALGDAYCEFELLPISEAHDQTAVAFSPDPKLGRQINLLEMLFERMPMGIAIIDRDFKIVRCNPTWAAFIERYTPSFAWQVLPGARIFDLEPGTEETLLPLFEQVFQGETIRQEAIQLESGGTTSYWDIVLSPLYEGDQIVGLLNVSIDASERVQAEQKLTETLVRLGESESMLRSVIENARHFAIYRVQVDRDNPYYGKIVLVSPSIQELLGVEDPYQFENWFAGLHPDDYDRIVTANRRSLVEGVAYNQPARVYNQQEKRWHWIQTISNPGFDGNGRLTHFDGMIIDLTDQKEAEQALKEINATLEERVEVRTRELATLLEVSNNVSSTLELDALLGMVLDQLKPMVDYNGASLMILEGDSLRILAYRGPIPQEAISRLRIPFGPSSVNFEIIHSGKPLIIPDIYDDLPPAKAFRQAAGQDLHSLFAYIRCWMGIPLMVKGRVMGMLSLDHGQPGHYTSGNADLALAFANQAASAIENARLYTETRQHAEETQTLFAVQQAITSRLNLESVLKLIADEACRLTSASQAAVFLLEGESARMAAESGEGIRSQAGDRVIPLKGSLIEEAIKSNRPLWIADAEQDLRVQANPIRRELMSQAQARSVMVVPLLIGHQPIGAISITEHDPDKFNEDDERILSLLASSAVIGIENARLYEQLHESAVTEERNRLARDLHDAVSQTLFSANLVAESLPKLWERDPETGKQKLEELHLLTRSALSEMRTLLLELRPSSLVEMDLADLLRHLTNAFTGRSRIHASLNIAGQVDPAIQVKEVIYRVVQESLNNISKHAQASQVSVTLERSESQIQLEIVDNGHGFDLQNISPDHLGLSIMRERAGTIGAQVSIQSEAEIGTRVALSWKDG